VGLVLIPAPPTVSEVLAEQFRARLPVQVPVEVIPAPEPGSGSQVRAALAWAGAALAAEDSGLVVVHDSLYPLTSADRVGVVVDAVRTGGCSGVVPVRSVIDTVKWVDGDGVVRGTADRDAFRLVGSPQVYRARVLADALASAAPEVLRGSGAQLLPRVVWAAGGRLHAIPDSGEILRAATADDLLLVEAVLHVGATDGVTASG
jgi:2-C-methyl-D-erythritol 4-phosphate cytidylyltransferase